ncbi:MAG TPA: hypothetical protein ENI61_01105 [Ignavibacteria bacterium]|nr:hypothetical protein [Ignavibacteria bacterium]
MFKFVKKKKNGQVTLEYTVLFVIILTLAVLFAPVFKKTIAAMYRSQLDTMIKSVDDSNNCCKVNDNRCKRNYRRDYCNNTNGNGWVNNNNGKRCNIPVCLLVNMTCTVEQILDRSC